MTPVFWLGFAIMVGLAFWPAMGLVIMDKIEERFAGMAKCPRCGDPLHPQAAMNVPSWVDQYTWICRRCAMLEAYFTRARPTQSLPPVDQPVPDTRSELAP